MKKVLASSLLTAEIAAISMLMLLFFMNTNKPYLLLIPIAAGIGGYFAFKVFVNKLKDKRTSVTTTFIVVTPIALGALIAVAISILLNILN
jgi:uncharacterized membrane protein (DUF4010 family)